MLASTLKVVVLDRQPSASIVAALVNLVYLHFERHCLGENYGAGKSAQESAELGMAIRFMSVNHVLRSLSVAKNDDFYSFGLDAVIVPPFVAGATPEQGGPSGPKEIAAAVKIAEAEAARPANSALPRVDWNEPCGLTDVTLTCGLLEHQQFWVTRLPLVRLELGSKPAPDRPTYAPAYSPLQAPNCFANLQVVRWEFNTSLQLGVLRPDALTQCRHLRVLQLSALRRQIGRGFATYLQSATLVSITRFNAETLEELRLGVNIEIAWGEQEAPPQQQQQQLQLAQPAAPVFTSAVASAFGSAPTPVVNPFGSPAVAVSTGAVTTLSPARLWVATSPPPVMFSAGFSAGAGFGAFAPAAAAADAADIPALARSWPSLLACTRLRVVELQTTSYCAPPERVMAALACLPSFHSLELVNSDSQYRLPANLAACVSHSRSWSSVCITLDEDSPFNLLRVAGGMAKLMPPEQLNEAAVQRLRVYGFKDAKRQVLAVQTDKKGLR